jgi:hypothetical protein
MTATWYRVVTDCNQSQGACAYALAVEPLFSDGTDHGIGPVGGACGSIRVIGTDPNGLHVDDTYTGCTVNPPPSWTAQNVALFAVVLKHRVTGTWFWTATMTWRGASGTGAAVCPRDNCPVDSSLRTLSPSWEASGGLAPGHLELTPRI